MALAKMVGFEVTPLTAASSTRVARPPGSSRAREISSIQMLWPRAATPWMFDMGYSRLVVGSTVAGGLRFHVAGR